VGVLEQLRQDAFVTVNNLIAIQCLLGSAADGVRIVVAIARVANREVEKDE
jgi:hypothetical protein